MKVEPSTGSTGHMRASRMRKPLPVQASMHVSNGATCQHAHVRMHQPVSWPYRPWLLATWLLQLPPSAAAISRTGSSDSNSTTEEIKLCSQQAMHCRYKCGQAKYAQKGTPFHACRCATAQTIVLKHTSKQSCLLRNAWCTEPQLTLQQQQDVSLQCCRPCNKDAHARHSNKDALPNHPLVSILLPLMCCCRPVWRGTHHQQGLVVFSFDCNHASCNCWPACCYLLLLHVQLHAHMDLQGS